MKDFDRFLVSITVNNRRQLNCRERQLMNGLDQFLFLEIKLQKIKRKVEDDKQILIDHSGFGSSDIKNCLRLCPHSPFH